MAGRPIKEKTRIRKNYTTTVDEELLKQAKIYAVIHGKNTNDIIEEALSVFLALKKVTE